MKISATRIVWGAAFPLFLMAVAGCSAGPKMSAPSTQTYGSSQLEEFVNETGPPIGPTPEYRIAIGDRLDVVFLYHSNLTTRDLLVRSDGRISLPYVGDQVAMGYTPMQLDTLLTEKFSEILKDPNLSVIVSKPVEQTVYVLGNVKGPGGYPADRPISILQAIAKAGGFQEGAKPQNTILIRRVSLTKIVGVEINVKAIMDGKAVQSDILLKNYDIVFVPQTRLKSVADFVVQVRDIVSLPLEATLQGWQIATMQANYEFYRNRNNSN